FEIGNFASLGLFGVGVANNANYLQQAGLVSTQIANPELTWEKSEEFNIGTDLGFFENRVLLSANAFERKTAALLLNRQLPLTSGFASISQNIGSLQNRGLEFELTTQNVKSSDFTWTTNFNLSFIRNKVTALVNDAAFLQGFASRVEVGQPLGAFYGYEVDRLFQTTGEISALNDAARAATGNPGAVYQLNAAPGDIKFKDIDGIGADGKPTGRPDGVVNSADQRIIGSAQPNFFGGINNTLGYKGIDLGFFFQFTQGNEIYNNTRGFAERMNGQFGQLATVRDRWTPTNTDTDMPRAANGDPNNNGRVSDRFLEDGSYLRLKTITLGYNLPTNIVKVARLQSARIYVSGQNVLTFTKYQGLDPEVSTFSGTNTSPGTDFLTFPQARTLQVGVNIGL
ncbi:MAG TPA: SusC/RagA family TonB-linked outer membrane protein, partial [Hymenobacter sp.]